MDEALAHAVDAVAARVPPDERDLFGQFVELYFHAIPKRYRTFLEGSDLGKFLLARWEFLEQPIEGRAKVRVFNPNGASEAWNVNVSVLEANLADRPFIVDSLRERLRRLELEVHLTIHPVLAIERDAKGRVCTVASGKSGGHREAFVYIHFDRVSGPQQEALSREIGDVLEMVCTAVDDYQAMQAVVRDVANQLVEQPELFPGEVSTQGQKCEFLLWLLDGNFTFMGSRRSQRQKERFVPTSTLGLFDQTRTPSTWADELAVKASHAFEAALSSQYTLTVARLGIRSPVHRAEEIDYISVRKRDRSGTIAEVTEVIGLLTTAALNEKPSRIPLIKDKLADVVRTLGFIENSHSYKNAVAILNSLPKEYLFNSTRQDLLEEAETILAFEDGDEVLISLRPKPREGRVTVTIRMPEANYSATVKDRILQRLRAVLQPLSMRDYHWSGEGDVSRLHIYAFDPTFPKDPAVLAELSSELQDIIRTWQERLITAVEQLSSAGSTGEALARTYSRAFPEAYRSSNSIDSAIWDIVHLQELSRDGQVHVGIFSEHRADGFDSTEVRFYKREKMLLSAVMPILTNLGLVVVEERTTEVKPGTAGPAFIHSFQVRTPDRKPIPAASTGPLSDYLTMIFMGRADSDALNGLVLAAGLDWKAADLLIAYRNFMFQIRRTASPEAMNEALLKNPEAARALWQIFDAKLNPALVADRAATVERAQADFDKRLEKVASINSDRVLRALRELVDATVRTNFYLDKPTEQRSISVKVVSGRVSKMPDPKPFAEIYVHAPGVEAVHLRGGKVARGGIRWSDRPDDFRTEILGLMKTQMVKNSVIVPVGSKGGFVLKRSFPDRKQMGEEMVRQYTVFMKGLLDVTDNRVRGETVHPQGVVCHDDFDPYLVVAADKGTAAMSDTANSISKSYDFWLGDAFASGGSAGYSHKAMGITARGGWVCVERHFRELGVDLSLTSITAVGIGDMSGDVFGNGLLMSRKLRLVAAFDHRHIFVDPHPEPEAAFQERERLFKLPASSWADYNPALISKGGGVYSRGNKRIELSPEARAVLGISAAAVNGEELIRAILTADCDLLWNGGIGTYLKGVRESNLDVGDKANDEVRVNGSQVRARVIGEGGNLGVTQLGRIEYARKGGRINTDAIDNSGGVDCSDHEVNLKILFKMLLEERALDGEAERNEVLAELTDEVGRQVLRNNYLQSALLSMDELRSKEDVEPFLALINTLVKSGHIDRDKDKVPSDEDLRSARQAAQPIPRPVLALLTGWAKMVLFDRILASDLPDRPENRKLFIDYFPAAIWKRYQEACLGHHLRREIIATSLANRVVNQAGVAFVTHLESESGDPVPEVVRVYTMVNDLLEGDRLRREIHALDNRTPAKVQYRELLALEATLYSICLRVLRSKLQQELTSEVAERYEPEVRSLKRRLREHVSDEIRHALSAVEKELTEVGFPQELAQEMAAVRYMKPVLTMVRIREHSHTSLEEVAGLWYRLGDELFLHYLEQEIQKLVLKDEWDRGLHEMLTRDLARYQRKLTLQVLTARQRQESLQSSVERFLRERKKPYARLKIGVTRLKSTGVTGLVPVQVLKENYEEMLTK